MNLTFDEHTHTYCLDGAVIPGVTQVLAPLTDFSAVPGDVLAAAAKFGKSVHKATELDDLGQLDMRTLSEPLVPYLRAWQKFCAEHEAMWLHIEHPVFHDTLRYAGTVDRIGSVDGNTAVLDVKSTARLYPAVGPQLAAYQKAATNRGIVTTHRYSVLLKPDGTYDLHCHSNGADFSVFASLLTLRTWCRAHKVTPQFTGALHD